MLSLGCTANCDGCARDDFIKLVSASGSFTTAGGYSIAFFFFGPWYEIGDPFSDCIVFL